VLAYRNIENPEHKTMDLFKKVYRMTHKDKSAGADLLTAKENAENLNENPKWLITRLPFI
jgi:hypothetical protein